MNGGLQQLMLGTSTTYSVTSVSNAQKHYPDNITWNYGSTTTTHIGYFKWTADLSPLNTTTDSYAKFSNTLPTGARLLFISVGIVFNSVYRWYFNIAFDSNMNKSNESTTLWYNSSNTNDAEDGIGRSTYIVSTPPSDGTSTKYFHWNPNTLEFTYYDVYNSSNSRPEITSYPSRYMCGCSVVWRKML